MLRFGVVAILLGRFSFRRFLWGFALPADSLRAETAPFIALTRTKNKNREEKNNNKKRSYKRTHRFDPRFCAVVERVKTESRQRLGGHRAAPRFRLFLLYFAPLYFGFYAPLFRCPSLLGSQLASI